MNEKVGFFVIIHILGLSVGWLVENVVVEIALPHFANKAIVI